MVGVFKRAALFAVVLLVATAGLGLWIGDLHGQTDPAVLRWGTVHRLSGVLAALVVVLVNSMAVTYFVGTSRWVREVAETYGLSPVQADAILRLTLGQLVNLEQEKLAGEHRDLLAKITEFRRILGLAIDRIAGRARQRSTATERLVDP